jgi:CBS domain-containing protein
MITASEIMTMGEERAQSGDTVTLAARRMRDQDVTSLPVCAPDGRLAGIVTERDIVVRCVAEGLDPRVTRLSELASDAVVSVGVHDSLEQVLTTMIELGVRHLPVTDDDRLVGTVSQADVARGLPLETIGDVVAAITRAELEA